MLTFGPVPSRRLGRSLGINNIPQKFCSYSCLYCQVGRTVHKELSFHTFYQPGEIFQAVKAQISAAQAAGEKIDYLTFVPEWRGEQTSHHSGNDISRMVQSLALLRTKKNFYH